MAVYTQLSPEQVRSLLDHYDLGGYKAHEGIAKGVSNSNFHLFTDKGRYILTLFEKRRVNYNDLPFFFDFAEHLAEQGIACPRTIEDKNGQRIHELEGRACAILKFLDGDDIPKQDLTADHCGQMGSFLAKMHIAAEGFGQQRENTMGIAHWSGLVDKAENYADQFENGLYDLLCEELSYLRAHWPSDLPKGVIHADLFPDNVFFDDGKLVAAIDFYFSCTDFYAFDLAVTMNAWCFEGGKDFSAEKFQAMMMEYQAERPLSADEKESFRVLCRGVCFRFLLSRLEEYYEHKKDTQMVPHDPGAYLNRLKFHQQEDVRDLL